MRILFLTQVVPYPLDSGPKIKTHHVLRYLANAGHSITLVSFIRTEQERQALSKLLPYCSGGLHTVPLRRSRRSDIGHLLRSLLGATPFLILRDNVPEMARLIHSLVDQAAERGTPYDVIQAVRPNMAQYARSVGGNLVLDTENAEWKILQRMQMHASNPLSRLILGLECQKMRHYEARICQNADRVLAVSEADRRALLEAGAVATKITVVPIAVDCEHIRPVKHASETSKEILIVSTLFYPPNADGVRWFLREVYPLVCEQVPDCKLTIIGARPPRDIVQFATQNRSSQIAVKGYVQDLRPYLERASLMVVPVRVASGMRVKILEAWALGIPVVSTTIGCEGLSCEPGKHLLVADTPRDFAASVLHLLRDEGLTFNLSAAGRELVEARYDWRVVMTRLGEVYDILPRSKKDGEYCDQAYCESAVTSSGK